MTYARVRELVVVDTGPLFALINKSDAWHERVFRWWEQGEADVVVAGPVLPEVCYLLSTRISSLAEIDFLQVVRRGDFEVEYAQALDLERAVELMKKNVNFPLGYVDASVVAIAERLGARTICTTDRRHFGSMRDRKGRAFALVP